MRPRLLPGAAEVASRLCEIVTMLLGGSRAMHLQDLLVENSTQSPQVTMK